MRLGLLFTLGAVVSMVLSDAAKKKFNKDCPFFFAFICALFALIFFVFASGFKFNFNKEIIVYSALFGVAYALAILFVIFAYKKGNFFTSGLVMAYSLLLPTLYGIIFLKDKTSIFFYIGLALLCVAVFFIFFKKKEKTEEKPKLNFLWVLLIGIAFVGNGFLRKMIRNSEFCNIQKLVYQERNFDEAIDLAIESLEKVEQLERENNELKEKLEG